MWYVKYKETFQVTQCVGRLKKEKGKAVGYCMVYFWLVHSAQDTSPHNVSVHLQYSINTVKINYFIKALLVLTISKGNILSSTVKVLGEKKRQTLSNNEIKTTQST